MAHLEASVLRWLHEELGAVTVQEAARVRRGGGWREGGGRGARLCIALVDRRVRPISPPSPPIQEWPVGWKGGDVAQRQPQ